MFNEMLSVFHCVHELQEWKNRICKLPLELMNLELHYCAPRPALAQKNACSLTVLDPILQWVFKSENLERAAAEISKEWNELDCEKINLKKSCEHDIFIFQSHFGPLSMKLGHCARLSLELM